MKDPNYKDTKVSLSKSKEFFIHYQLLMWKNFLLRKRRPWFLLAEILVPLMIPIILVGMRTESPPVNENTCHVRSVNLPTMGLFSYLQSIVCNFLYRCHSIDPDSTSQQYNYTVFGNLLENISSIVGDLLTENITKDFQHYNISNFLKFMNDPNSQSLKQLKFILFNIQQIYQDIFNELIYENDNTNESNNNNHHHNDNNQLNELHNKTINFGIFNITIKQIYWLSTISRFICGTKTSHLNDIGQLMEFIKDIDFTNLFDIEKKLIRIQRSLPLITPMNSMNSINNNYKINCISLQKLLHNKLFIQYTGRIRFLLNGYIFYYPVNQWTNEIMYRVMEPQRLLLFFKNTLKQYQLHTKPILNYYLSNTSLLIQVRHLLNLCILHSNNHNNSHTILYNTIRNMCKQGLYWLSPEINNYTNETNDLLNKPIIFNRINNIIDIMIQLLDCFPLATNIYGVNNETNFNLLMDLFKSQVHPIVQGIIFNNTIFSSINHNNYTLDMLKNSSTIVTIRQSSYLIDDTNNYKVLDHTWHPGPRNNVNDGDTKYFTSGFLDIQDLISNAIIEISNNLPERIQRLNNSWNIWNTSSSSSSSMDLLIGKQMKFFPTTCYINDKFLYKITKLLPQLLILTWILTAMLLTKYIVEEKELYIKEFTKIMGFTNIIHWFSWFSSTLIVVLPITIIITIILKYGNIIILSNIFIIFLLFISYIISIIMFCFLCSIFFYKANLSAIITGLFYFILYIPLPIILMNEKWITEELIIFISLSNQVAFCLGLYSLLRSESQGFGTQWNNIWHIKLSDSLYSPGKCILMLWIDSILYLCITLLIEWIISNNHYIYQLFYSRIKYQNWKIIKKNHEKNPIDSMNNNNNNVYEESGKLPICIESNTECLPISISVKNISKIYTKNNKPALNQLTVDFYTNQITSLLGHNGSGKSTLISILTGIHKPSNGTAYICGYNIYNQMNIIRTNLGYCPQHNILFDYFTVIEHIKFYAKLKGFNNEQMNIEIQYFIKLLNLNNKLNDQVKYLSGGQKRKLSIAIAFIGHSSIILLDEPTTGIDPYSRRSIWDLIIKMKLNKTIIITTHHMDEADILGDRIAIISQGQLKCYGSSLYLKSIYNQGYYLILERQNQSINNDSIESYHNNDILINKSINYIINYLKQYINDIHLIDYNQNEFIFRIPIHNVIDNSLSHLLKQFENQQSNNEQMKLPIELISHGIISYGLTDTSLEEIFLSIADDPAMLSKNSNNSLRDHITITNNQNDNQYEIDKNQINTSMNRIQEQQQQQETLTDTKLHESNLTDIGQISSSSSTTTTLLRHLNHKHDYKINKLKQSNDIINNKSILNENIPLLQSNIKQQMKAMFIKRLHYFKRSKLSIFIEFILPICVLILALKSSQFFIKTTLYKPMIITPWLMINNKNKLPLNTFYENNLYELNDPIENLMNQSQLFKSILNIGWNYENALKKPLGWTGIGCLPKETLKNINGYYKIYDQCNLSNIKIMKTDLTYNEMKYIRSIQSIDCSCNLSCSINSYTSIDQQPSFRILPTKDIFYNLTSFKVSNYLMNTQYQYIRQRYGGLSYHTFNYPSFRKISKYLLNSNHLFIHLLTNTTSIYDINNNLIKKDTFWIDLITFLKLSLPSISYLRIWFNNKGYVSGPAYLNSLHNLQLNMLLNNYNNLTNIIFINYPLSLSNHNDHSLGLSKELLIDLTLSLFTLLSLSLIPASFISFLIKENNIGSKHLQIVSGLKPMIYWLTSYLWDIMNYIICGLLCIIIFIIFEKFAYIHSDVIYAFILLILLYGIAIIPMLYMTTYFITSSSTSLVILSIFNLLIGSITCMCTLILDDFSKNNLLLEIINNILKYIFTIFPQYCLSRGLFDLAKRYYIMNTIKQYTKDIKKSSLSSSSSLSWIDYNTNPLHWNLLGHKLFALFIEACLFFLFVLLKENKFFIQSIKYYFYINYPKLFIKHHKLLMKKLNQMKSNHNVNDNDNDQSHHINQSMIDNNNNNNNEEEEDKENNSEDEDVHAERLRISKADKEGYINSLCSVAVINLTKFFPRKKKPSVNRLTFGVRPGECFGLLGVNGAGKTTTFNMITGKLHPSMGTVYVNGFNVVTQTKNALKNLGYCPQFDAVHDLLTGRETLTLYARLRGFPEKQISTTVNELLQNMGLLPYADRITSVYSGGNLRKLSTAIAIIGKPQVILLDEPTSGMDPIGKRFMWDQIISLIKDGRSIILTTHSMEECEVLCQSIGIMINGQLKCFGSIQHLKNRYGNGYHVEIRLNHLVTIEQINQLKNKFNKTFPHSILNELQSHYYEYQMNKHIQLSILFKLLNKMQFNHYIEHYSVKQTTLDQVFVNFSRNTNK
ncbi:ATP-binding cassette sub- A member 12 [Schistosoma haematobium]|uniref:ATP-binding cassette sub- A member 12 n=1 Tax=Schistosoma haematobium TaxID=6185 RepID=A0A922LTW5_SCHHA|nr:ATP-binding cassette sub- A member 12 [Schistosoma haematobium]KAH9593790.1 ATP-binding cassette sub- A member 12 [Schistosoma haematobium]